jgi:pyruvate/2-oxoglutarate dehydrogenase complex dihydrolipoamide acyltransferase (E2) component
MSKQIDLKCPWLAAEEITASVVKWLVRERDRVEIDQDIMVMLLDDSEFLLPSPVDGIIKAVLAEPGEAIEPDQVLAIIELE